MLTNPVVSVVMPVRNGQRFVELAIQSVLNQTLKDFELIIVDDGSTDRTWQLCKAFQDSRIRLLQNPSTFGVPKSLNRGILASRSRYIARLDADDVAMPERLERQVLFLEQNPLYGIVGSWMRTIGDRSLIVKYPVQDEDIRSVLLFRTPFGHPAVTFRKDWDNGFPGLYNEAFLAAQDYDYWDRISKDWKCRNLPECLTEYRLHDSQHSKINQSIVGHNASIVSRRQFFKLGLSPLPVAASRREQESWWDELFRRCSHSKAFSLKTLKKEKWLYYTKQKYRPVMNLLRPLRILRPLRFLLNSLVSLHHLLGKHRPDKLGTLD